MLENCENCTALEAEIKRLKSIIERANLACEHIQSEAATVLNQSSGVARGKWAFAKSSNETAAKIGQILGA